MANPFQDQLLKAGLVSKDRVNKANKSKHKQAKQKPKNQLTDADERKQLVKQADLLKMERDRELNREKLEADNKKAIEAQIRQLVEMNQLSAVEGDTIYNFVDGGVVKQIHVADDIRKQIINGRLAIARLNGKYQLVPQKVANKIMQRDASFIVVRNETTQDNDEEDEYADYKVPDDLMW